MDEFDYLHCPMWDGTRCTVPGYTGLCLRPENYIKCKISDGIIRKYVANEITPFNPKTFNTHTKKIDLMDWMK